MKIFIVKVLLFFALIAVVDILCGYTFGYIVHHAKGGFTHRDTYICDSLDSDILLMGSSRCVRHYNPQIIEDSLGLSCYNSGQDGNGIILNYGRIKMINERSKPKMVIYDVNPHFDLYEGFDDHRDLIWLKQHYDRDGIADVFIRIDETEHYKMMSQMYRYNSRIIELMVDFFHPIANARSDGFSPFVGEMDRSKIRRTRYKSKTRKPIIDPIKLEYMIKFIDEQKDCRLFFVVSPIWYGMDTLQLQPVKEMCRERGIPFIDFSNNPKYVHHDEYFKNGNHMNARGADEFTRDLVANLKGS